MSVKNILSEQFKDLITEDTLTAIEEAFEKAVDEKATQLAEQNEEAFNQAVNNKVVERIKLNETELQQAFEQAVDERTEQRVQLEVENATNKLDEYCTSKLKQVVEKIDADHTAKLQKLVEAIDTDHAIKLQKLVKSIDKKHTAMLQQVVEKYENTLKSEAVTYQNRLVEEISNYIDLYLQKTVPTEQISEAVNNIRAAQQLQQIRQIVGISEEFISNEVKEALVDGKKTIDSLRSELNSVLKENVELSSRASKAQAYILLEKKTADMPKAKKAFVNKLLKNKSPEYIEENFSYVVDMFEKDTQQEVEVAKEEVQSNFKKVAQVDRPRIIEEQQTFDNEIERTSTSDGVSGYLNELLRVSGSKFTNY